MDTDKTPGQIAYEADLALCPRYPDGAPRRTWTQLDTLARSTWEKNPTPRRYIGAAGLAE